MKNTKMEKRSELDIVRVSLWYWYIRVNLSKNSDYQIEKVIEDHSESLDDIQITDDEQQEATSTLLGSMPFDF